MKDYDMIGGNTLAIVPSWQYYQPVQLTFKVSKQPTSYAAS
jgi:hypothetical protein